jgi:short-subunit dehydrogenase
VKSSAPKAIVIGASSGIGRSVAKVLAEHGYDIGLTGRRVALLKQLQQEIKTPTFLKPMDLSQPETAMMCLATLIDEMGGLDLVVINAGVGSTNFELDWENEFHTATVNAIGFMAMANVACKYFMKQGYGHLVGVSSVVGIRGVGKNPAYAASKAFVSNYLDGLRQRVSGTPIYVTDIRPGFVDTALLTKRKGVFWMATPDEAARQIYAAIVKRKLVAYVTRRWNLAAAVFRVIPNSIYDWIFWKVFSADRRP